MYNFIRILCVAFVIFGTVKPIKAAAIASGLKHICAIATDSTVRCWGDNIAGALGNGTVKASPTEPVLAAGVRDAVEVVAGANHTCARLKSGKVQCWGANYYGQLGIGLSAKTSLIPAEVYGLNDAVKISAGDDHTCAVTSTGSAQCWGAFFSHQTGALSRGTPVDVPGLSSDVVSVSAGAVHTCAVKKTGKIVCWGSNSWGELGQGHHDLTYSQLSTSTPIFEVPGINDAVTVTAGKEATCATSVSGKVYCWGASSASGTDWITPYSPLIVSGVSNIQRVSIFENAHSCALSSNGTLTCWGNNYCGTLGSSNTSYNLKPFNNPYLSGVTDISERGRTCVISNNDVLCLPEANTGSTGATITVGTPCKYPAYSPVKIGQLSGAISAIFSATASGTTDNFSLDSKIAVASHDSGLSGKLYVVAVLPSGDVYSLTSEGWSASMSRIQSHAEVRQLGVHDIQILVNQDVRKFVGAKIYVGYGLDESDMVSSNKYSMVYSIK